MIKLIFRKLYFDIASFFGTSLVIVGLIVWTIQAVNYFDIVTEDGHGIKIYFYYSLLNFPRIIQRILPFIFFLSVFYTIVKYEKKNEIFIFWVNGINKINFLNKLLIFSLICMFVQIILSSYLSPLSKNLARNYLKNSNIDFFTSLIKERKFINITQGLTIFIEKKGEDGIFENIFLEDQTKKNSKMIYASRGLLIDNETQKNLELFNGKIMNFNGSKMNIFDFDQIIFNLQDLNSKTISVPKIQEINTILLSKCFLKIDIKEVETFDCQNKIMSDIKIELFNRLYKPIYIPIIVLISCFLILFSKNENNYKKKINYLFLIVFIVLVFSEMSVKYIGSSDNFTNLYLFGPFIIFFICYYLFYKRAKNV
jgi:lipopolysaccharide export system permease protein